jgi:glutaredoxin
VNPATTSPPPVEVFWRPGCPFCSRLRSGLRRAGVSTVERNIWSDPEAAARVREVTGGDETVPTVLVGSRSLVNPSVSAVVSALRAVFPEHADGFDDAGAGHSDPSGAAGAALTMAVVLLWAVLALWRPTTTWHLAPVLVAGAWPWLLSQAGPSHERGRPARLLMVAVAGFAAAGLATLLLSAVGLLRGPTLPGFTSVSTEAVVLAGATMALAVLFGLLRVVRRSA